MLTEFGRNMPQIRGCRWREGIFRHALVATSHVELLYEQCAHLY